MKYRSLAVNSTSDSMTQKGSHTASRRPSGESSVKNVFGFPVEQNQFNVLQVNQTAESSEVYPERGGARGPQDNQTSEISCTEN